MYGSVMGSCIKVKVGSHHLQCQKLQVMKVPGSDRDRVFVFVVFLVETVKKRVMEGPMRQEIIDIFHHQHDDEMRRHFNRTRPTAHIHHHPQIFHISSCGQCDSRHKTKYLMAPCTKLYLTILSIYFFFSGLVSSQGLGSQITLMDTSGLILYFSIHGIFHLEKRCVNALKKADQKSMLKRTIMVKMQDCGMWLMQGQKQLSHIGPIFMMATMRKAKNLPTSELLQELIGLTISLPLNLQLLLQSFKQCHLNYLLSRIGQAHFKKYQNKLNKSETKMLQTNILKRLVFCSILYKIFYVQQVMFTIHCIQNESSSDFGKKREIFLQLTE